MSFALIALLALMAPQQVRIIADAPENSRVETPPEVAAYTDPFYSRAARDKKIEGTVTVEAAVDEKGSVTVSRTVKSLGYGLDENALAALRQWKFCPALRGETPINAVVQIDIDFKLTSLPPSEFDDTKEAGLSRPMVVNRVEPQYTDAARAARIGGTVVLQTVVKAEGTAKVVKIVRPLPYGLTENAIRAIEQWTFTPAKENGRAIPVSILAEVDFKLEGRFSRVSPACPFLAPER